MSNVSAEAQRAYRVKRRYGLTLAEYDAIRTGQGGTCALCRQPARLGAFRVGRRIVGFLCWGCRTGVRLYQRFPSQRLLLSLRAQDRLSQLIGPLVESEHRTHSPHSLPLRESSESVKGVKGAPAQADLIEAQRRLALNPADEAALRVLAGTRDRTGPEPQ